MSEAERNAQKSNNNILNKEDNTCKLSDKLKSDYKVQELNQDQSVIPGYFSRVFKNQCISATYGNIPIYQKTYICPTCLPNDVMCEVCYYTCHKYCKKFKNPFVSTSFFVCGCSKTLKHRPLTQKEEEEKKTRSLLIFRR